MPIIQAQHDTMPQPTSGVASLQQPVLSVLGFARTYAVIFILLFFVMGGYLPQPSARVSSLSATSSPSDTIFGQLFQAGTWALAIGLMAFHRRKIFIVCQRVRAFVALSSLAVASAAWSQDPANTLRRGVFLLLGTFLAFYLVRSFSVENLAQIIVVTGVIAGLLGIAVSAALPAYGRDNFNGGAWQGIFRSKNGCAQIMLFFLSAALCFHFRSFGMRWLRLLLFPIAFILIVMSKAATGYMLLPGMMLLVVLLKALRRFDPPARLAIIVFTAAAILVAGIAMPYVMPLILDLLGKDPEMSGRLPLWSAVTVSALKRPMLGYGYAAFWTGLKGESLNIYMKTHFEIYQAQNGILEVWLEIGLAGALLVAATLIRAAKDCLTCLQHDNSPAVNWYVCMIVLTVIYNIDETFLAAAHSLPWLLYVVACTGLADIAERCRCARVQPSAFISSPFIALPIPA